MHASTVGQAGEEGRRVGGPSQQHPHPHQHQSGFPLYFCVSGEGAAGHVLEVGWDGMGVGNRVSIDRSERARAAEIQPGVATGQKCGGYNW